MTCNIKLTIVILCFFFLGCSSFKEKYVEHYGMTGKARINFHKQSDNNRLEKIQECIKNWKYNDLNDILKLTVLQYTKASSFDLFQYPAMIIGTTANNDTLRILKYNFKEDLKIKQSINVFPDSLIIVHQKQNNNLPTFFKKPEINIHLSKDKEDDLLYCKVKKTYFGNITQ